MKQFTAIRFRKSIMLISKAILTFAIAMLFFGAFMLFYSEAKFFRRGNIVMTMLFGFIYVTLMRIYRGYEVGRYRIFELLLSQLIVLLMTNFVMYFVLCLVAEKMLSVFPLLTSVVVEFIAAIILYTLLNRLYMLLYKPIKAIMIYNSRQTAAVIAEKFRKSTARYDVVELISEKEAYSVIKERINEYKAVIAGDIDVALREKLVAFCYECTKTLFITPNIHDILLNNATLYSVEDIYVYQCKNRAFSTEQMIIKRLFDIVTAFLGLIITLPVTLLTALLIYLGDRGPIFFTQKRLTRNGHEFTMIKFRSMVVNAEKMTGAVYAKKHDSRITPIGRVIRSLRIDEIPQLINILQGNMSFVGPRPERPELFEEICEKYPQFRYRLKVKAGLTGYAQLFGKYNTLPEDKVKLDLMYIENASILQDLKLIFYTIKILFLKESTEGVSDNIKNDSSLST